MLKILPVKLLAVCLLFTLPLKLLAQNIQINLSPSLSNTFGSADIWNASIINPMQSPLSVKLKATVNAGSGAALFEAVSAPLTLNEPVVTLNHQNVQTQSINYFNPKVRESDEKSRSFPTGEYMYCLFIIDALTGEVKAQECMPVSIKVLTPPILIYPGNKESVQEKNPLLTWLFPGPISNPDEVKYTLTLVELYPDQSAFDGMLRNRPLIYEKGISQTSLQYPFNAPELKFGKNYAWQVEAVSVNGASYGLTEIWEFNLQPDSLKEADVFPDQSYVDIKNSAAYQVYYAKGTLKIKHTQRKYPQTLRYAIYTEDGAPVYTKGILQALAKDNWFEIDLEKEQHLKHKQKYRFELGSGEELYKVYFYYINPLRLK
ncbi:hypothetical protein [Pedobacter insulae]|uniref:Uncharacterized protein n=1 Tax=Pedobacter insulae TaxID=414048 RepID=A0A1I2ZGY5_9SPHI|nr:hypothetical protein [Pedobacter insulae]SFH37112.1 hypothetical protein SAMN04489864_11024 [Pedobacter insulae]